MPESEQSRVECIETLTKIRDALTYAIDELNATTPPFIPRPSQPERPEQ